MALVIDIGSDTVKAGYAGTCAPAAVITSIVGEGRNQIISGDKTNFIGDDAQLKRDILHIRYPIERGIITDWDNLETLMKYTCSKLDPTTETKHDTVLLSEIPLNSKIYREMMTTFMFEKFNVSRMYLMNEAVLALYSTGRVTGLVVDSGHGVTHTVPIYEGYSVHENINRIEIGGQDVTEYLAQLLHQKGYRLTSSIEKEWIVRNIKETLAYVAPDFKDEMRLIKRNNQENVYNLPDGQSISLTSEHFQCAESIFHPHIIGISTGGIAQCAFSSMKKCDGTLNEQLSHNIIFSGGNTMFPNILERMTTELNSMSTSLNVNCFAPSERKYSAWIGGSIIASLNNFKSMWITKQEYNEFGSQIIHRKCI